MVTRRDEHRRTTNPKPGTLLSIPDAASYLNVSQSYLYRLADKLGPEDGFYLLHSTADGKSRKHDLIRIDVEKFLQRSGEPADSGPITDPAAARRFLKQFLGELEPMANNLAVMQERVRLIKATAVETYDSLSESDPDSDSVTQPDATGGDPQTQD